MYKPEVFDFRPASIASYGHFDRNDLNLPWEKLDMSNKLSGLV